MPLIHLGQFWACHASVVRQFLGPPPSSSNDPTLNRGDFSLDFGEGFSPLLISFRNYAPAWRQQRGLDKGRCNMLKTPHCAKFVLLPIKMPLILLAVATMVILASNGCQRGRVLEPRLVEAFRVPIEEGDFEKVRAMLAEEPALVNGRDKSGGTPLHLV